MLPLAHRKLLVVQDSLADRTAHFLVALNTLPIVLGKGQRLFSSVTNVARMTIDAPSKNLLAHPVLLFACELIILQESVADRTAYAALDALPVALVKGLRVLLNVAILARMTLGAA